MRRLRLGSAEDPFGLRDSASDRYYFVGQNCLSWLKASGLVARARYRQSAEVAYRKEMENRRNGDGAYPGQAPPAKREEGDAPQARPDLKALRRTFFIAETESHFQAIVRLEHGRRRVSGHAQEPRWSRGWARNDGAVVLLERVPRPRRNAVAMCVLKAYRQARAAWRKGAAPNGNDGVNDAHEEVKA